MRRRILAALLSAALLLLAACGLSADDPAEPSEPSPSPTPAGTPTPSAEPSSTAKPFALAWDSSDTLDPLTARATNRMLAPLVFQGLFSLSPSFEAENALCGEAIQGEDGLSWRFALREGVAFSDGTELTAAQAARCLNAARTSEAYRSRLAHVTAVTAEGETVVVTLDEPCGALPALLDIPVYLEAGEDGCPLGTGPYRFERDGEALRLCASSAWQGENPPAEVIPLYPVCSSGERITAFDAGEISLVDTDLTGSDALGYSCSFESWDYATSNMLYMGFNMKEGPCEEENLRRAVALAVDRGELTASMLSGHGDAAVLPVSPLSPLYDRALADELDFDQEEAARLLEEAGYGRDEEGLLTWRGRPVELVLLVNSDNPVRSGLADRLASELAQLGLRVTVTKLPWDQYLASLRDGTFDLYLAQVRLSADFDLTALLSGELNFGGYEPEEDAVPLFEEYRAASGEGRGPAAAALYTRLAADAPFTPLCFTRGTVLTRWGQAAGLSPLQSNLFYGIEQWSLS